MLDLEECEKLAQSLERAAATIRQLVSALRGLRVNEQKVPSDLHTLRLPIRIENALESKGIKTIDQLCTWNGGDLLYLRGIGIRSILEITRALEKVGRSLPQADAWLQRELENEMRKESDKV